MTIIFACILACAISFALTFLIRNIIAPKLKCMDIPTDARRMHAKPIPLIGGLGIYIAFTVSALAFGYGSTAIPYILGGGIIVVCGILDDKYTVSPLCKLLCQCAAGIILCLFGVTVQHICFFGFHIPMGIFQYPMTVLWVMAVSNAFNLIDGLDGLCSGITVIASGGVGLLAIANGHSEVFVCAMILMLATLGFLPHNTHPAKIFLGDTGSMFLGFVMAAMCINVVYVDETHIPTVVAIVLIGLPVFDTSYAIVRRLMRKQKITMGDKEHVHHILCNRYSHPRAVALMYLASIICVGIALFTAGGGVFEAIGYGLIALAIAFGVIRFRITSAEKKAKEESADTEATKSEEASEKADASNDDPL